MPAGLDGNPNPSSSPTRDAVLRHVADRLVGCEVGRVLVAVDGRSGSGKSTFADELAHHVRASGVPVIRSTTDSFHRPRVHRLRRGASSAHGYYEDSHQIDALTGELLGPFASGSRRVRTAAFDEPTDRPLDEFADDVPDRALLVFDGLFLQRAELRDYWQLTIYLEADHRCDQDWLKYLTGDLPVDPSHRAGELDQRLQRARWPRYRHGWQLYLDAAEPETAADIVIDNNDFLAPTILRTTPQ